VAHYDAIYEMLLSKGDDDTDLGFGEVFLRF
jgi:hypothetical protein